MSEMNDMKLCEHNYVLRRVAEEERTKEEQRWCVPVVRVLASRSGDPGFKAHFDHSLNMIQVVPGSTSQLHTCLTAT